MLSKQIFSIIVLLSPLLLLLLLSFNTFVILLSELLFIDQVCDTNSHTNAYLCGKKSTQRLRPNRVDEYKSEIISKGNYIFAYILYATVSVISSIEQVIFLCFFFFFFEIHYYILLRCSFCLFL